MRIPPNSSGKQRMMLLVANMPAWQIVLAVGSTTMTATRTIRRELSSDDILFLVVSYLKCPGLKPWHVMVLNHTRAAWWRFAYLLG